jgi:hypothetical protein
MAAPSETGLLYSKVKGFWNGLQDAQHAGRLVFPPWSQPVLNHAPSQRLPSAPAARPIDPSRTKKDQLFYWYRPAGSVHSSVNRLAQRWPGQLPYERAHLASSHSSAVSQLPEHLWSGYPKPDSGPGAELIAKRLLDEDAQQEQQRIRMLQHRALCHERTASREAQRRTIELLSGMSTANRRSPAPPAPPPQRPQTTDGRR